jgi:hypothetical protein
MKKLFYAALSLIATLGSASAAEMCNETIEVRDKGQPTSEFIGSIVVRYGNEGGGDPKKYRHLYLFLPESICFVSKDEDRLRRST